jgi:hypothetical protein
MCNLWHWIVGNGNKLVFDLILTGLLAYPLFHYMILGWKRRVEELEDSLSLQAKRTYLKLFRHLPADSWTDKRVEDEFYQLYRWAYGRKWFIAPIAFAVVIALITNFVVAEDLIRLAKATDLKTGLLTAPAAMAGAYTFVTYDFFARVQRRCLLAADILRGGLRLAIAIPMGFAFAALFKDEVGPFIAFAVGVFPLGDLLAMLRQIANEKLNLKIGQARTGSRVVQLLGVDPNTADRIEDADISTIPQLSTCDPVDLAMRACLQFRFVANMCSQALAWIYLGAKPDEDSSAGAKADDDRISKLNELRPLGLAGALEIKDLMRDLASPDPATGAKAKAVLDAAAAAVKLPVDGLRHTFEEIDSAPHAKFLHDALFGPQTVAGSSGSSTAPSAPGGASPPGSPGGPTSTGSPGGPIGDGSHGGPTAP